MCSTVEETERAPLRRAVLTLGPARPMTISAVSVYFMEKP